jgi:PAS domain S-box-containing protein
MSEWCYDYTYWDDMVEFVKNPDSRWAKRNIEASTINYSISFAWVFDSKFNQKYGYQTLVENGMSDSFLKKEELNYAVKENWFSNFFFYSDGKIFEIHTAPVQPSMDIERKTQPKGWLLVGRVYQGKLIDDISHITNSNIKMVFADSIKSFEKSLSKFNAGIYASIQLKDFNKNTLAYLTSFHIDKATEQYINSAHSSIPIIAIITFLFFGSIFLLLLIYVVKPISVLSNSLSSEDEAMLAPLFAKKNEFGALSRMMERFFIQKKHLETEIKIRTETEIELKEIQTHLEHLVEDRTAELLEATNLMQVERDQAKLYLEMAGAVICLLDEDANILLINKMGYDVLGYKDGELIGRNWMDFCYDQESTNSCSLRFDALMNGNEETCNDYTFCLRTVEGEERKLLINSIVTKNPLNGKRSVLFSGVDITAIKKTENDLIEAIDRADIAYKAQAAFFANMSHELRTPLFGILGYSEMMATGDYSEEIKHMSSTINKGGKRLIETLNKVLNLSKLKADKFELKLSEVNLNKLIIETVNLFKIDADSKGLNLHFNEPDKEIITYTDSAVIRDIITNLIHNAIKFTFYGDINIFLQSNHDYYSIKVKDTGIGIPPSGQNLIFEEFRQVSEGYSRSFEGTGLGLAITKKYLDILNGKIELNSAVNKGSEFIVSLPLKQKEIQYAN